MMLRARENERSTGFSRCFLPRLKPGLHCLLALFCSLPLFAAPYAGRPLSEALRDLESKGLRLIYSSDIVRPDMTVKREPVEKELRRILDELLREHRLRAKRGPRGSLIIVKDDDGVPESNGTVRTMPVALEEIIVTPSQFRILGEEPARRQFLSRDEVRSLPHLADDLYRAISRVPGLASTDITARFHIRGGEEDEVQVLLDGVEIYDPFHLRDLFRAFSTIDAESVGSVEILTGGFPAQYGGRMSGVIDIASFTPEERRTEFGISLLNTRLLSAGRFDEGRGEWLVSVRRGYLRELLQLIDNSDDLDPRYYDLFGKFQRPAGDRTIVSANVLAAQDKMDVRETDGSVADASYTDAYAWINARTSVTTRLFTQNVLSYGRLTRKRDGVYDVPIEEGSLRERRKFDFVSLKHDASFDVTPRNVVKWGVTARRLRADYDYAATATIRQSIFNFNEPPITIARSARLRPSGSEVSIYVADRVRLTERLVVEAGGRADRQSWTPDGAHFSPRVNAAWAAGERTSIRAGWGRFYQSQRLDELQVEDGINEFFPAQRADHRLIGIDHAFRPDFSMRVEAYDKRMSNLRPRFENIYDRVVVFPELRADRMRIEPDRAFARGAEILIRKELTAALSGWVSFSRSSVVDEIDGQEVPRSWDQRNALNFSMNYRRGDRWNFNIAGTFHGGRPTTPVRGEVLDGQFRIVVGARNSERLADYRRIDFRASRNVPVGRGGLSFFLELFNALNFSNVTRVNGFNFNQQPDGTIVASQQVESIIGILPSFGVSYQF